MDNFANSPDSKVNKQADSASLENNPTTPPDNNNGHHNDAGHIADVKKNAPVSPLTWLSDIFKTGKNNKVDESENLSPKANANPRTSLLEMVAVLPGFEEVKINEYLAAATDMKFYGIPIDLATEIAHRVPNAPERIKDFYKNEREAQMGHRMSPLGNKERGELAAWTLFGEREEIDKLDEEGRKATAEYVQRVLDRGNRLPSADERTKDHHLLAKIHSLLLNDHDALRNSDEIARHGTTNHLSEDIRKTAEDHMFVLLESIENDKAAFQSPLNPQQKGEYLLQSQIMRQVVPLDICLPGKEKNYDAVVQQYADLISDRNAPLAAATLADWQMGIRQALIEYPNMSQIRPARDMSDAERIREKLLLTEVRQIRIEEIERAQVLRRQGVPAGDIPKRAEAPLPDHLFKKAFNQNKMPFVEYREARTLEERAEAISHFESAIKPIIENERNQNKALEESHLAAWRAHPTDWRIPYLVLNADANANGPAVLSRALPRFGLADQCDNLSRAVDLYTRYQDDNLTQKEEEELLKLDGAYNLPPNQRPCKHFDKREPQERIR